MKKFVFSVSGMSCAMCENHIKDDSMLKAYVNENLENAEDIFKQVNYEKNQLIDSECNLMTKAINERLQYIYIFQVKDQILDALNDFGKTGSAHNICFFPYLKDIIFLLSYFR